MSLFFAFHRSKIYYQYWTTGCIASLGAGQPAVLVEIEKLRRTSLAAMRQQYREVFGEDTRCRNREHLFRRIAWRLQALADGDLT